MRYNLVRLDEAYPEVFEKCRLIDHTFESCWVSQNGMEHVITLNNGENITIKTEEVYDDFMLNVCTEKEKVERYDREKLKEVLKLIYLIGHGKYPEVFTNDKHTKQLIKEIKQTCVCTNRFINWHTNPYFPNATIDNLKKIGWCDFYLINENNYKQKTEYFNKVKNK